MRTGNKILSSGIWSGLDVFGRQGVQFIVHLVLARLLLPSDFGSIAAAVSLNQFISTIVGVGLVDVVIQKKNLSERELSTAFWLNFLASTAAYIFLFILSPVIAGFFDTPELVYVIRVMALSLIFNAINNIQFSQLYRNMAFQSAFWIGLPALLISGFIAISLAFLGFGIWALITHYMLVSILRCIFAAFASKWRPLMVFDKLAMIDFIKFSWGLIGLQFIDQLSRQIYVFIIGGAYTTTHLGYYSRAISLQQISSMTIAGIVARVGLPTLSKLQDNSLEFIKMFRKAMRLLFDVMAPILVGISVVSESLVPALLGPQWQKVDSLLSALCIGGFVMIVESLNRQAVVAKGAINKMFRVGLITKTLQVCTLLLTYRYGLDAIVLGQVASMLIGGLLSRIMVKQITGYAHEEFIRDIAKPMVGAALIFFLLNLIQLSLLLKITFGASIYLIYSFLFKLEYLTMISRVLRTYQKRFRFEQ